jgi:hypothetical protein
LRRCIWVWLNRQRPATRTGIALVTAAATTTFLVLGVLSSDVQRQIRTARHHALPAATVLDVVLEPDPGAPGCWSAVTVERHRATAEDIIEVNRATVSLLPGAWPPAWCASHIVFQGGQPAEGDGPTIAWTAQWQTDTDVLQSVSRDCWGAAWFQFGRVPQIVSGTLRDLRLENPIHRNFTALPPAPDRPTCPSNATSWRPPRADVLDK